MSFLRALPWPSTKDFAKEVRENDVEQTTRLLNNQSKVESNADLTPERLNRLWPASP